MACIPAFSSESVNRRETHRFASVISALQSPLRKSLFFFFSARAFPTLFSPGRVKASSLSLSLFISLPLFLNLYICVCVYIYISSLFCLFVCVHIHIYIYTYMHISIYLYIYMLACSLPGCCFIGFCILGIFGVFWCFERITERESERAREREREREKKQKGESEREREREREKREQERERAENKKRKKENKRSHPTRIIFVFGDFLSFLILCCSFDSITSVFEGLIVSFFFGPLFFSPLLLFPQK